MRRWGCAGVLALCVAAGCSRANPLFEPGASSDGGGGGTGGNVATRGEQEASVSEASGTVSTAPGSEAGTADVDDPADASGSTSGDATVSPCGDNPVEPVLCYDFDALDFDGLHWVAKNKGAAGAAANGLFDAEQAVVADDPWGDSLDCATPVGCGLRNIPELSVSLPEGLSAEVWLRFEPGGPEPREVFGVLGADGTDVRIRVEPDKRGLTPTFHVDNALGIGDLLEGDADVCLGVSTDGAEFEWAVTVDEIPVGGGQMHLAVPPGDFGTAAVRLTQDIATPVRLRAVRVRSHPKASKDLCRLW